MADRKYADGLLRALLIIAEEFGPIKTEDMNKATWKALNAANQRLSKEAAEELQREKDEKD